MTQNQPREPLGALLEMGASDWRIYQQRLDGAADVRISGRWAIDPAAPSTKEKPTVYARLVQEATQQPVTASLDWQPAEMMPNQRWVMTLANVPAGGLYRLETCLRLPGEPLEWASRGDMAHHLGVGDLWLIAGQSNAVGYGRSPVEDGPTLGVHQVHADGSWKLATHPLAESTNTRHPANRERANPSHSPYLAFGRRLMNALGWPIGLIPAALGASPLSAWNRQQDGQLFENALGYLDAADGGQAHREPSQVVSDERPRLRGLLWYQGEADCYPGLWDDYLQRFAAFVADLRQALHQPSLPILTCQLNRCVSYPPSERVRHEGWQIIREAQRRAAHEIPGVDVVSTMDLSLCDGVHNDSSANLAIAQRLSDAALGAVYGRAVAWRCPEIADVQRSGPNALRLRFDHVVRGLSYANASPHRLPLSVWDERGQVPIIGWQVDEPDAMSLELGRALEGAAKLVGGNGSDPPEPIPFDLAGGRPMLGFLWDLSEQ